MDSGEDEGAKAAVQKFLDLYLYLMKNKQYTGYDVNMMTKIKLLHAWSDGRVEWELVISPFYANLNGVMHGGAAGVLFDMGTTTALCPLQKPGYWDFMGGVTRTLNISYLKAIPIGTTVRIRSKVLQHGRTMALIRGSMESVDGKTVFATCDHHKVNAPTLTEHLTMREKMLEERRRITAKLS